MIIVCVKGGLGNQMFQYALYYKMKKLGKDVYLDLSMYEEGIEKRKLGLTVFPNVEYIQSTKTMNSKFIGEHNSFLELVLRKFGLKKDYFRDGILEYHEDIFMWDNIYLDGFWQCEKYFEDTKEEIRNEFIFPQLTGNESLSLEKKIKDVNSVSVHVRRGDYLNNKSMYGDLSATGYYTKAIEFMEKKLKNPVFFFFSDDIEWVKKEYAGEHRIFVDNGNKDEHTDMQLMSICKHNIIANSSYSWWGAWLNNNQEKIVVAPAFWNGKSDKKNIYCEGWTIF